MTKHDSKTADELILDNAPDSATHYCCGTYCKANKDFFYDWDGEYWCAYFVPDGYMRSLADIEAIVEKDKKIAELETALLKSHGWIAKAMMQGLNKVDCSDELLKIIAIRDLEQQAKGIKDAIEYLGWEDIYTATCPNKKVSNELRFVAGQLSKEAQALKERG